MNFDLCDKILDLIEGEADLDKLYKDIRILYHDISYDKFMQHINFLMRLGFLIGIKQ